MSDIFSRIHSDCSERKLTFERIQDVEPILDRNKALQSERQNSDWGKHVATVPAVIIEKWLNEEAARGNTDLRFLGPGFDDWFQKKINEPDNKAWRVDNPSNPFFMGYGS